MTYFSHGRLLAKVSPGDPEIKKEPPRKAAGMQVHLLEKNKTHSINSYITLPFNDRQIHPLKVHLSPDRKKISSAFIRRQFIAKYSGFDVTVSDAIWNSTKDVFQGHGKIAGLYLPGEVRVNSITFNNKGILKIDGLIPVGNWIVGGFPFSPHSLTWTKDGIQARGMLMMKTFHPDVIFLVTDKGVSNIQEPLS